jgi:dolichol-phosphate mannosyltransferase
MKTVVIVPTYNEAGTIAVLIDQILKQGEDIHVLVVDDNSGDNTGKIVDDLVQNNTRLDIIHRPERAGLGTAYICGFKYALSNNYDFIITMDADFSHNPDDIPRLQNKVKKGGLVIGSRYCGGIRVLDWPVRRLLLSIGANCYARTIGGLKVNDCTSGYRCYSRQVLEKLPLNNIRSNGYAFLIEILFYISLADCEIEELPIIFTERRLGQSKMTKKVILESAFMPLRMRFCSLFKMSGIRSI